MVSSILIQYYHSYLCIRSTIFQDFPVKKLGLHIKHKNSLINFYSGHIPHHMWNKMSESKLHLSSKLMRLTRYREIPTEMFLYHFISSNARLFLSQICCMNIPVYMSSAQKVNVLCKDMSNYINSCFSQHEKIKLNKFWQQILKHSVYYTQEYFF